MSVFAALRNRMENVASVIKAFASAPAQPVIWYANPGVAGLSWKRWPVAAPSVAFPEKGLKKTAQSGPSQPSGGGGFRRPSFVTGVGAGPAQGSDDISSS